MLADLKQYHNKTYLGTKHGEVCSSVLPLVQVIGVARNLLEVTGSVVQLSISPPVLQDTASLSPPKPHHTARLRTAHTYLLLQESNLIHYHLQLPSCCGSDKLVRRLYLGWSQLPWQQCSR